MRADSIAAEGLSYFQQVVYLHGCTMMEHGSICFELLISFFACFENPPNHFRSSATHFPARPLFRQGTSTLPCIQHSNGLIHSRVFQQSHHFLLLLPLKQCRIMPTSCLEQSPNAITPAVYRGRFCACECSGMAWCFTLPPFFLLYFIPKDLSIHIQIISKHLVSGAKGLLNTPSGSPIHQHI